jgi:hypothetical protein
MFPPLRDERGRVRFKQGLDERDERNKRKNAVNSGH